MRKRMSEDTQHPSLTQVFTNPFPDLDIEDSLPLFDPQVEADDYFLFPLEGIQQQKVFQRTSQFESQFEDEEEAQRSSGTSLPSSTPSSGKFEKGIQETKRYERPNKSNIIFKQPLSSFRKESTFIPVFARNKHLEKFYDYINRLQTSKINKRTFPIVVRCFRQLGIVQEIAKVWEEHLPRYLETQQRLHGSSPIFNEILEICTAMSAALRQQTNEEVTRVYWRCSNKLAAGISEVKSSVSKFQDFMRKMDFPIVLK